eukprot:2234003-Amphidinium_carterae.1
MANGRHAIYSKCACNLFKVCPAHGPAMRSLRQPLATARAKRSGDCGWDMLVSWIHQHACEFLAAWLHSRLTQMREGCLVGLPCLVEGTGYGTPKASP